MAVLHFVANTVYPAPGGLGESALRIAHGLASRGLEAVIYTLGQPAGSHGPGPADGGVTVVHLGQDDEHILGPFHGAADTLLERERSRVKLLSLKNAIATRLNGQPRERHLVISFYASGTGFLAQHAATRLRLPHVASVRGTDFACDLISSRDHPKVRFVLESADQVIATNREQAQSLPALIRLQRPIRVIHNAIQDVDGRRYWEPRAATTVQFLSDAGFSGRKGSHLLIRAIESLLQKGLPVSLTVLGGIYPLDSQTYWRELQQACMTRCPSHFHFPGQTPREEIDEHLLASHVYCSASLAEGCSLSRIRAMTIGIPIVTTRCGALPEVASGCRHVRLCPPGDWMALARQLEAAVAETMSTAPPPDRALVESWRRHFSAERERREWLDAIQPFLR